MTIPDNTYYVPSRPIVKSQEKYIEFLKESFRVFSFKDNNWIQYNPVSWQREFHAYSINALKRDYWKDRLVVKGRGISFSVSSMMDMVVSAEKFKNLIIPIVTHREQNALDLIRTAQDLIDNAKIEFQVERPFTKKEIIFKSTGTIIRAYPSSNANAVRQLRTFTGLLDEITFYRDIKKILDSAESIINEGGQITMGSTIYDRNNYFWELYQQQLELKKKYVFTLPIFDKGRFNINESIIEQVEKGLKPLVPWQDLTRLEDKRTRDKASFLRENMCTPSDENVNFISIEKIIRNCPQKPHQLISHDEFETTNPLYCGIDVATENDYVAICIFEDTQFGLIQRHIKAIRGMELPDLQRYLETMYFEKWDFSKVRIDMTGLGTQLAQYLRKKYGSKVEMIHFASKIQSGPTTKQKIREKMAYNLLYLFEDDRIKIIDDSLLIKHLNAWSWDLSTCHSTDGHGDFFWACALACLPLNYKSLQSQLKIMRGDEKVGNIDEPKVVVKWKS